LNAQHPHIQATLRRAFDFIELHLVFNNAFPDTLVRSQFVKTAIVESAQHLGFTGLVERLNGDTDGVFMRALAPLPNQRISTFRGSVKKIADAHVVPYYKLTAGNSEILMQSLFEYMAYIYPGVFNHDIFASIVKQCFFTGPHSLGVCFPDRFTSSLALHPDQKEIPIPMLALIGAAVHASLTEWKAGVHKSIPFSADSYLDAYNEHTLLLDGIKANKLHAFHKLMHQLYLSARCVLDSSSQPVIT
ncbi:hypothetical protein C8Q76DRAFT_632476, partial [Earliella scabrosa]